MEIHVRPRLYVDFYNFLNYMNKLQLSHTFTLKYVSVYFLRTRAICYITVIKIRKLKLIQCSYIISTLYISPIVPILSFIA